MAFMTCQFRIFAWILAPMIKLLFNINYFAIQATQGLLLLAYTDQTHALFQMHEKILCMILRHDFSEKKIMQHFNFRL